MLPWSLDDHAVSRENPQAAGRPRRAAIGGVLVSLVLGACAVAALIVVFTQVGDPCPAFDDEGPMAAPHSPYARVMCEPVVTAQLLPMSEVSVPPVALAALVAGAVIAAVLVWRRPGLSRQQLLTGLAAVLVVQPLMVVALQYALPRDCLSGPTLTGDCARDREDR